MTRNTHGKRIQEVEISAIARIRAVEFRGTLHPDSTLLGANAVGLHRPVHGCRFRGVDERSFTVQMTDAMMRNCLYVHLRHTSLPIADLPVHLANPESPVRNPLFYNP
jgi:hypothetical protein